VASQKIGHRGDALRRQIARQFHRRESFVNGVSRTGKQADLLAGNHRHRAFARQLFQSRAIAILLPQGRHQGGAPLGREAHFTGSGFENTGVGGNVGIEGRTRSGW
jgi:hypothetical protein